MLLGLRDRPDLPAQLVLRESPGLLGLLVSPDRQVLPERLEQLVRLVPLALLGLRVRLVLLGLLARQVQRGLRVPRVQPARRGHKVLPARPDLRVRRVRMALLVPRVLRGLVLPALQVLRGLQALPALRVPPGLQEPGLRTGTRVTSPSPLPGPPGRWTVR